MYHLIQALRLPLLREEIADALLEVVDFLA